MSRSSNRSAVYGFVHAIYRVYLGESDTSKALEAWVFPDTDGLQHDLNGSSAG